ncbi:MAG: ribonuclease H-like domain-containing protein [Thermoleophilia bacterium]
MDSLYLDIETRSFPRALHYITVVGFYHASTGLTQMIWPDITAESLSAALPDAKHIYTYNGNGFDLPVIRGHLGLDLLERYKSRDLMYSCRSKGIKGGLKKVEFQLGIDRDQHPLNNFQIQECWTRWKHKGDEEALKVLLKYNEEDVMNLVAIREKLGI